MRITDLLYFLRQIFFPNWKPRDEEEQDDEPGRMAVWFEVVGKKLRSGESIGTAISILLHVIVLLLLSWLILPVPKKWDGIEILMQGDLPAEVKAPGDIVIDPGVEKPTEKPQENDAQVEAKTEETVSETPPTEMAATENSNDVAQETVPIAEDGTVTSGGAPKKAQGEFAPGGGFGGRTREGRGRAVGSGECTSQGENCVEKALEWLAAHQNKKDGGWSFDFAESCKQCSHGGTHGSRIAATGLALLPFLGSGYTHKEGPYTKVVEDGLYFLLVRAFHSDDESRGAALNQGSDGMYSHGIATMAICEAYAMSKSQGLKDTAQKVLLFIENAQCRQDGGWRYLPNPPKGDISATAWQLMALKSGKLGGLHVSQPTLYLAADFLEAVAMDGGRQYRYLPSLPDPDRRGIGPDSPKTSCATGLLLRMYLGWEPGERMLDEGMERIAQMGPLKRDAEDRETCNLYFAYYATLAMHHYDGSNRKAWNREIREFLIQTQSQRGHEHGSWYFPDPDYCDKGGRLLNTVLATLILETPYRIMPLFRR